jgi:outer membrane protein OmpU
MKKILIASTALVATAGIAAADVAITGYAEIGMADLGDIVGAQMHSDMDVTFKLSGATDNGLTFGASIDLDEVSSGINSTGGSQAIHVSGAFGTLTMGDTDGALDKANAEVASLTAIADDHTAHSGYNGGAGLDSGDILRYDTTFNGFGVSASIAQADASTGISNDVMAYGVTTSVGTVALSAAYQSNNTQNITAVSAKTTVGGLTITGNYSESSTGTASTSYEHSGLGVNYDYNGVALHANMGSYDYDNGQKADGMGVAANYGLGGGATVMVGYGNGKAKGLTVSKSTFSVGLGLSF